MGIKFEFLFLWPNSPVNLPEGNEQRFGANHLRQFFENVDVDWSFYFFDEKSLKKGYVL